MSWGTCYSASNNIHFDYPAMMSDGRLYTDYNTSCDINKKVIKDNNIKTNYQYRQYLINNATKIINENNNLACDECGVCKYGYPLEIENNKYRYKSCSDMTQPYGYENSDLKNMYLSRESLQSRLAGPILSQQGYLQKPNYN